MWLLSFSSRRHALAGALLHVLLGHGPRGVPEQRLGVRQVLDVGGGLAADVPHLQVGDAGHLHGGALARG
jgi:hypothetical protein